MAEQFRPHLVDEPRVWFGVATGMLVVTFLVAAATDLSPTHTALAAIAVAGLAAVRLPLWVAPALGALGWALYTGFVENAFGELTLAGSDLARLGGFAAASAVIAYAVRESMTAGEVHGG
jgi:hypothetical protein